MIRAPIWHPVSHLTQQRLPAETRAWLLAPGSTTKLFNSLCQQPMQVHCLQQGWQTPLRIEALCLDMAPHKRAMLREVELFCDGELWMYARTVVPSETLVGKYQHLKRWGTRPLGNLLFRDPLTTRSGFEVAFLKPEHLEYQLATRHLPVQLSSANATLLARRSIFLLDRKPILLTEVYLPACVNRLSKYVNS